jgi:hypothetical protein
MTIATPHVFTRATDRRLASQASKTCHLPVCGRVQYALSASSAAIQVAAMAIGVHSKHTPLKEVLCV